MAAALSSTFMAPTCSTTPESIEDPVGAAVRVGAGVRAAVRAGAGAGVAAGSGNAAADATSGFEETSVPFGADVTSRLSAYLHFGCLSAGTVLARAGGRSGGGDLRAGNAAHLERRDRPVSRSDRALRRSR